MHFSFLGHDTEINDTSAVIVTIPMAFDHPNFIVGESLYDFLCFGIYRGFFALEQLGNDFEETFVAYTDPNWQPMTHGHFWVGLGVDDHKRGLLDFIVDRFGLVAWQDPKEKFERLQATYLQRLDIPTEDEPLAEM